jgi:hypothetical protein
MLLPHPKPNPQNLRVSPQAARRSGLDFTAPPSLGSFSSLYGAVSVFYSHWLNFSTVKEFLWAAEYNLATAPNRQVRRLMEAENAKKVRAMRKKFNEEVRALAAWCKKRDKRVMERALEQKKLQVRSLSRGSLFRCPLVLLIVLTG